MNNLKILILGFLFFSCKNTNCETNSQRKIDSLNNEIRKLERSNREEILTLQNEVHRISVSLDSVKLK